MGPRPLYEQAKTALIKNISMLNDVGDLPYHFVRSILHRVESPTQLREIEKSSPQIIGLDGELWEKLIQRDVSGWEKKVGRFTHTEIDEQTGEEVSVFGPRKPEDWYKVYKTLVRQAEEETREAEQALFAKNTDIQKARQANRVIAPTRMIPPKQSSSHRGPSTFSKTPDKSTLRFTGGSKTKDVMAKARREAAEHKAQHSGPLGVRAMMRAPQRGLLNRVQQAPDGFLDRRKQEVADLAAARQQKAGVRIATATSSKAAELAAREARLRSVQGGCAPGQGSLLQGITYKVPKMSVSSKNSSGGGSGSGSKASLAPPAKRKREVDMFHNRKKR
ncbi:hypothetical protein EG327_003279 [Venturia inaequalis]|uniref:Elongin-A n=1 Tax=Venturia inaequalis TaxID=5025 RepID=A0A8H3ZCA4_VENIN|nr:hypothetical protein EG327_003279 [Venturia inaequalis]